MCASKMKSCRLQGDCRAGFGLADHSINDETIVDHSGSDWGVHTHAFSFLNAK